MWQSLTLLTAFVLFHFFALRAWGNCILSVRADLSFFLCKDRTDQVGVLLFALAEGAAPTLWHVTRRAPRP